MSGRKARKQVKSIGFWHLWGNADPVGATEEFKEHEKLYLNGQKMQIPGQP